MANWLVNLNWDFNIQIWQNCQKNGRVALGWRQWSESEIPNLSSYQKATGYFKAMRKGDRIISFLKDRRLGSWGTVTKEFDEMTFDPQLNAGSKEADFGRVVQVRWEDKDVPPPGQAARMKPDELHGFSWIASVNPLKDEAFERLAGVLKDKACWEPIAELAEERDAEDQIDPQPIKEEWLAPLRESALRKMLARNLSLLEAGLKPFDAKEGAEEISVGAAGRIDLLCKDTEGNLVVIELKRDSSSDQVVGQLLRYMGYVKENHLGKGKIVRGIIVAHDADERLRLALQAIPNVELKLYKVDVTIRSPEKRGSRQAAARGEA